MARSTRRWATVAWAAFLTAAALELVVFAFVDPQAVRGMQGGVGALSATAVYSLAFFVFWALAALGCWMTLLLSAGVHPPRETDGSPR